MKIKLLSHAQISDISSGLNYKIKRERNDLTRWIKGNPTHPNKVNIVWQKQQRIKQLENLKSKFSK